MKKLLIIVLASFCVAPALWADDEMRNVQTELKSQGFYYGELDGKFSSETAAAIKRYQIRNGLEVTGTLTKQTVESLGLARAEAPRSSTPPATPSEAPGARPPTHLRREDPVRESDRSFLRREEAVTPRSDDPSVVAPPVPLEPVPAPGEEYRSIFERTPYATAPREVQESTVRRAQILLAREGYYRDAVDGAPGPATEEALLAYQRRVRLPLSGRLDLQTLAQMRLLPTRAIEVPVKPFYGGRRPVPQQRTYRGIWID
jgi:peptidoglycan hydrolase-like protein with peptidoglycan-binding domain